MDVSPIELTKIKKSLVNRIIRQYPNVALEFEDLFNEATLYSLEAAKRYDKSKSNGAKFNTYAYAYIRGALSDLVRRKQMPNDFGSLEMKRVNADSADVSVGLPVEKSFEVSVEAEDMISKLRETCDERDLEILSLMQLNGWGCTKIGREMGLAKSSINKRVRKMRVRLLSLGY